MRPKRTHRANGLLNWWAGLLSQRSSYEPAHLSAADRLVFALALGARALIERETRYGIAGEFNATQREGNFAGRPPWRNANVLQEAQPVGVLICAQRAGYLLWRFMHGYLSQAAPHISCRRAFAAKIKFTLIVRTNAEVSASCASLLAILRMTRLAVRSRLRRANYPHYGNSASSRRRYRSMD